MSKRKRKKGDPTVVPSKLKPDPFPQEEDEMPPEGKPMRIEQAALHAKPGGNIVYSPYGYIIMKDGAAYSLTHQWYHGIALAILFPKVREKHGYAAPSEGANVFAWQRFELEHKDEFDVLRLCPSRMVTAFTVDKGKHAASKEQQSALRRILTTLHGMKLNDLVCTNHKDMTVKACLEEVLHEREW